MFKSWGDRIDGMTLVLKYRYCKCPLLGCKIPLTKIIPRHSFVISSPPSRLFWKSFGVVVDKYHANESSKRGNRWSGPCKQPVADCSRAQILDKDSSYLLHNAREKIYMYMQQMQGITVTYAFPCFYSSTVLVSPWSYHCIWVDEARRKSRHARFNCLPTKYTSNNPINSRAINDPSHRPKMVWLAIRSPKTVGTDSHIREPISSGAIVPSCT